MLKHSVQIELFLILWVTKLIYSESPMYTVLDKDTIKNEILPHLSKAKRGYVTQSCLIEVVNAILYKLIKRLQYLIIFDTNLQKKQKHPTRGMSAIVKQISFRFNC